MSLGAQSYVCCELIFGQVPVGTTVIKTYTIRNKQHHPVSYYITRNMYSNPLYYVFDVNKYEVKVDPGEEVSLKISYAPNVPGSRDFDNFTVNDSLQHVYQLIFRGECLGPSVSCSVRNLIFVQTPKRKIKKHSFLLSNNSIMSIIFQFDCCYDPGAFQVEPKQGTLPPQEEAYITVRFLPNTPRFYSRQLYCLISHHEPILVNLFGIFSETVDYHPEEIVLRHFPLPHEERVAFAGYFSDTVTVKITPPPVSLSVNYLDFGRIAPEGSCHTLTTSLTNHMEQGIKVEWENPTLFQMCPEKLEIPPKQSALFECKFLPSAPCTLSWALINGQIFWNSKYLPNERNIPDCMDVPIHINMRFIGHSFPKEQVWISSLTVTPATILLPITLPTVPCWTTFIIRSQGHLPVLYKLLSPTRTNFLMKPMIGWIRDFQIIAVQLQSRCPQPKSYIEQWSIEVNGQVQSLVQMYVKAQTDIPRVEVGCKNIVRFEPVNPGTQINVYVPVRNVSFCQLEFTFLPNNEIVTDSKTGILSPNEEMYVTFSYHTDLRDNGLKEMEITCRVQCIYTEEAVVGEHVDIPVLVVSGTIYSELCALPQYLDCGEIEYGETIKTSFYIYNFGDSQVSFKLCHDHNTHDVKLTPSTGKCGPKEKMMIVVQFKIKNPGKHTLVISYTNRISQHKVETIKDDAKRQVFRIMYECAYPTLQIVELLEHNYGGFISNEELWHLLKIDNINAALAETNEGEIRTVDLRVPDAEESTDIFYLVFAIKNISNIYTKVVLKRRQICNCKQKESFESLSFRIKVFECCHKDMLSMELSSANMASEFTSSLTMEIKYLLPDTTVLSYVMELSSHRTIVLNIHVKSIQILTPILSVIDLSFTLNMGHVYIGLREPPVFAFWLYNNTRNVEYYKLDDMELTKLCNTDGFPVLQCLQCEGCVKPFSSEPLLFKFWPIEVKIYEVSVPLLLGNEKATLTVVGFGTFQKNKLQFRDVFLQKQRPLKNGKLSLSVDRLIIEPILVANSTERMFFIKNRSAHAQVQYTWKPCFIDGLVKIEPLINSEVLDPKETHPVIIRITSLNEPCSVRVLLSLEFVDYDQINEQARKKRRKSSTWEFTITNGGEEKRYEDNIQSGVEYFHIALPIIINIVGITDRDNCIPVEDQMKLKPFDKVQIDIENFVKEYFEKITIKEPPIHPEKPKSTPEQQKPESEQTIINKEIIQNALENIVGDAVFSEYFLESLKNLKAEPSPFYSQIQRDVNKTVEQVRKDTELSLTQLQPSEANKICEDILTDSLQTSFQLGPIMKKQQDSNNNF